MDLIQESMNIVVPFTTILMLLFMLPPYLVYMFVSYVKRHIYIENVAGKVVLITGASSGIGEYGAYEYARRRACLVLTARREDRLQQVTVKARTLGSPDVIVIPADVSNAEDCKQFVHQAIDHFGPLDHLVNNAGIVVASMFEDSDISDFVPVVDVNFWGSVYSTHFALSYLRKSKGKIIVIASAAGWMPAPRMSIYNASKAALITFYDTLRTEIGMEIGITIVSPGIIDSEMTRGQCLSKSHLQHIPVASTQGCAKAILNSACCGERCLTEPSWVGTGFLWNLLCPEILEWCHSFLLRQTTRSLQRNIARKYKLMYLASAQYPEQ